MPQDWLGQFASGNSPALWIFFAACCAVGAVITWLARERRAEVNRTAEADQGDQSSHSAA